MHLIKSSAIAILLAAGAHAEVTFQWIGDGIGATSVSNNGEVVTGNTNTDLLYETFRWTAESQMWERLGRATVPVLGTGSGTPDVSDDGTRISATILTDDNMFQIGGVWENGSWTEGWPLPADGGSVDSNLTSAWGLSGDGKTMVGLYWRPEAGPGSLAQAMSWDDTNGTLGLGPSGLRSSRANGANYDGSVVAGWQSTSVGVWEAAVWVDGVWTNLSPGSLVGVPASGVSGDGKVVVGKHYNETTMTREAARWVFDGANWNKEVLGILPGTAFEVGHVYCTAANWDGSVIVGRNNFWDNGPFSITTGFIWTEETGMVDILDFLEDNNVPFDTDQYEMRGLEDISSDGTAIVGIARVQGTFDGWKSFLIRILPDCPWDLDGDGSVGSGDLALIIGFWGQTDVPGDFNGDGVGSDDLAELIGNWGPCP